MLQQLQWCYKQAAGGLQSLQQCYSTLQVVYKQTADSLQPLQQCYSRLQVVYCSTMQHYSRTVQHIKVATTTTGTMDTTVSMQYYAVLLQKMQQFTDVTQCHLAETQHNTRVTSYTSSSVTQSTFLTHPFLSHILLYPHLGVFSTFRWLVFGVTGSCWCFTNAYLYTP